MKESKDPNTDKFGYPIFIGAHAVSCVTVGDSATLRYGTITEYDPKKEQIKITGGNCPKGLWRRPNQVIILMLPGDIPNDA